MEEPTSSITTASDEDKSVAELAVAPEPTPAQAAPAPSPQTAPTQGLNGPIPEELKHWNWGAFLLNWIWGISHNVWISLLMFVPFVNFFTWIYLGIKGNELAWEHRKFESVEQFKEVQKKWMQWGIGIFIAQIVIFFMMWSLIITLFFGFFTSNSFNSTTSTDSTTTQTN